MLQPGSGHNKHTRELRYTIEHFDGGLFRLKCPTTTHHSMGMAAEAKDSFEAAATMQSFATEPNNTHPTQPFPFDGLPVTTGLNNIKNIEKMATTYLKIGFGRKVS